MKWRSSTTPFLAVVLVLLFFALPHAQAQQPTSRVIPFQGVATTIAPGTPGQALTIQLWDAAATPPGTLLFSEAQTLDVDATGAISFVFGSQTVNGLDPANFPSGASRFLDVVDSTGASVLPTPPGRTALNAVAFALSPGAVGPKGDKGDPGAQGPPGVVQAVSAGDASIAVGGTAANPTVAVAANGITNANVADGALSPAKITGIAATLGPNMFSGDQSIMGSVGVTGNLSMVNSTATAGNILKGGVLFLHNFGGQNTFLGQNAGNLTMSGVSNTSIGFQALPVNTTGNSNTASGASALLNNTTGSNNTATGFFALRFNTTGSGNTASGKSGLELNTTGINNTASGFLALQFNTTGSQNAASGFQALQFNTTGDQNTASGALALQNNTTGFLNTASGLRALQNNTSGPDNTASGAFALVSNTTGSQNTASGAFALVSNTTGSNNTAIGVSADVGAGNLTNATAIGSGALVNASNKIRLGNTAVTVIEGQVAYTFPSDRNQKENFQPVDGEQVLRKIGGLGLTSWNYIGHDPKQFRHYGPVAQEFFAAFGHDGLGTIGTETTINSGDMEGILMIAVQALEKRTVQQSKRLDALRAENANLRAQALKRTAAHEQEKERLKETVEVLKAEKADLKGRIEKLERSVGSRVLAAKAE